MYGLVGFGLFEGVAALLKLRGELEKAFFEGLKWCVWGKCRCEVRCEGLKWHAEVSGRGARPVVKRERACVEGVCWDEWKGRQFEEVGDMRRLGGDGGQVTPRALASRHRPPRPPPKSHC